MEHAISLQRMFTMARQKPSIEIKKLCGWKLPPVGFLKLNVDGAMFRDQHKAGIGAILRYENGKLSWLLAKLKLRLLYLRI